ncbi:Putative protein of unknown function [Podospora comata]|uniref:Uncharacterized protein n=1 Tax=Podospora comata TaxID=48703 RepID=A0ABY6SAC2_PODCO|nr:Putative protein of unknown function [Podospora comata]
MEATSRTALPDGGGQKKKVKGRSKSPKSPTTTTTITTSNGASSEIARKSSTRVRNVVDYDEKRAFVGFDSDPVVPPPPPRRQSPPSAHQNGSNGSAAVKKTAHNSGNGSGLTELEERVQDLGDSWETESLLNDILGDVHEDRFFTDGLSTPAYYPGCFTPGNTILSRGPPLPGPGRVKMMRKTLPMMTIKMLTPLQTPMPAPQKRQSNTAKCSALWGLFCQDPPWNSLASSSTFLSLTSSCSLSLSLSFSLSLSLSLSFSLSLSLSFSLSLSSTLANLTL